MTPRRRSLATHAIAALATVLATHAIATLATVLATALAALALTAVAAPAALAAPPSSKPAAPSAAAERRAVELVKEAIALHQAGNFVDSAARFLEAFELTLRANHLRNAAKAFDKAGQQDRALELWKRYVAQPGLSRDETAEANAQISLIEERKAHEEALKSAEDARAKAEEARARAEEARVKAEQESQKRLEAEQRARIAEEEQRKRPAPPPAPALVQPAPPPAEPSGSPIAGWLVTGAGGAALATAGVLWIIAGDRSSTLEARTNDRGADGLVRNLSYPDYEAELGGINDQRIASGALAIGGAVIAAAGVIWIVAASD